MHLSSVLSCALALAALTVFAPASCQPKCDRDPDAQVLILGAGMAGLGAARRLNRSGINDFLILEQRDQIGGRVQSVQFAGTTIELGPQWVINVDPSVPVESQQPLWPLVQTCNVTVRDTPFGGLPAVVYNSQGEDITLSPELGSASERYTAATSLEMINRILDGLSDDEDLTVAAGLRESGWLARSPIEEFVEFSRFDAGPARPTDTVSYRDAFDPAINAVRFFSFGTNIGTYIVTDPKGYIAIAECLANQFLVPNDEHLVLESTVHTVSWGDECVCATATRNGVDREYCAPYAILTFSVGELAINAINFVPDLPIASRLNIQKLEMSNFLKVYIAFDETFWDTDVDFIFYVDEVNGREYYTWFAPWGDYFPHKPPVLQLFLTGDTALRVAQQDLDITQEQIAEVMRNIYGDNASEPVDIIMHDFITSRYFLGDFSTTLPGAGSSTRESLNHPFGKLYLAGEAYIDAHSGSTHGALIHGYQVGGRVAEEIQGPLKVTFVNDSPQLEENSITAQFTVSRPADLIECAITGRQRVDCSSGEVTFSDLEPGEYTLRVIARNNREDRTAVVRRIFIGNDSHCAVHLINSGLSIYGDNARVEFAVTGLPVTDIMCAIDSQEFSCVNPLELKDLDSGQHRVSITPVCEGDTFPYSRKFRI